MGGGGVAGGWVGGWDGDLKDTANKLQSNTSVSQKDPVVAAWIPSAGEDGAQHSCAVL